MEKNLTERVPELTYGVVVLCANIAYALLARALVKLNGPDSRVAKALKGYRKSKITLCMNVAGLAIGFFFPPAVIIIFALSMLLWVVPGKRLEQALQEEQAE